MSLPCLTVRYLNAVSYHNVSCFPYSTRSYNLPQLPISHYLMPYPVLPCLQHDDRFNLHFRGFCGIWVPSPCFNCGESVLPYCIQPPAKNQPGQMRQKHTHQCSAPNCPGKNGGRRAPMTVLNAGMHVDVFIYSFVHSIVRSFIYSFLRSFIYSLHLYSAW